MRRKKILILGGKGKIGIILMHGLGENYEVIISDIDSKGAENIKQYLKIDITDCSQLREKVGSDIDVIINLTGLPAKKNIVSEEEVKEMRNLYDRTYRTLLSSVDTVNLFKSAIEAKTE